jgi:hypothetical protein
LVVRGSFLPLAMRDSSRSTRKMMSIGVSSCAGVEVARLPAADYGTRAVVPSRGGDHRAGFGQISAHVIKGTSLVACAAETGGLSGHRASGLIDGRQLGPIG